jgi:hypothetical protein
MTAFRNGNYPDFSGTLEKKAILKGCIPRKMTIQLAPMLLKAIALALNVSGVGMNQFRSKSGPDKEHGIFDYLLYTLAGSVLAAFSFSFLLWLRF